MNIFMKAVTGLARSILDYAEQREERPHTPLARAYSAPRQNDLTAYQPEPKSAVNAWEAIQLEDLAGELWKELKIPNRKVLISNKGRLKTWRTNNSHSAHIILASGSSTRGFMVSARACDRHLYKYFYIHTSKAVLLSFLGEPEWAETAPQSLRRSVRVVRHLDGNSFNCALDNLCWVDSIEAARIERSFLHNEHHYESKGKTIKSLVDHTAPVTGKWMKIEDKTQEEKTPDFFEFPIEPEPVAKAELKQAELGELKEEWRDVKHYVGFYQVSNFGQVRSLNRFIHKGGSERKNKSLPLYASEKGIEKYDRDMYRFIRGRTLKPLRKEGEFAIQLCREGSISLVTVAQVMVENFFNVDGDYNYEYIDGNIDNCIITNLRLV